MSWLTGLPAIARIGDNLLVHAAAEFYAGYGYPGGEVDSNLRTLPRSRDARAWDRLLEEFAGRNEFRDHPDGTRSMQEFLDRFGGRRLVHCHTPIATATGQAPLAVKAPLEYADGRCVNVNAGRYLGGVGFLYRPRSVGEPVDRKPRQD